jgi:hypothetical protein
MHYPRGHRRGGASSRIATRRLRPQFRKLRARGWVPTPDEARLLAGSDKATVQVRLERALYEFER